MIITILIILIAIMGAPLFSVMGLLAIVNFIRSGSSIIIVPQEIAGLASTPLLHSIPLFTFAGYLLAHSKASTRLVRLTKSLLGWMPGGLAIVTILVCSIFTAFTGASGVTIVALGGLLLPALLSEKYGEKYSLGLVTSSGSFGLLFPPSLPIIMFGVVASASIDKLFIAGLLPGIFLIAVLSIHAMVMSRRFKVERTGFSIKESVKALWDVKWELPLPIILFGGIYSGKLAISDAASVTIAYVLIVEIFLTKDIKLKEIPKIMIESMSLVGALIIIMGVSYATTNYIIDAQIPQKLFEIIQTFITNKWVFLILLNIFLLIVGCIMDIFSAIVVVVPLILPIAAAYNINLIHLGIVFLTNLQIGYITPPVGMNLFIASIRFKKPVLTLYKSALIFIGLLLAALVVITYVPSLSIWFLKKPSIVGKWQYQDNMGNMEKLSIKSAGKYVRTKGSFFEIMTAEPYYGDYEVRNNILILKTDEGEERYEYEIYNEGEKLTLERIDLETLSETNEEEIIEENYDDYDFMYDDLYDEESEPMEKEFINTLSQPLSINEGKFISMWESDNNTIEFYYNNLSVWKVSGEERVLRYKVINPFKIEFTEYTGDEEFRDDLEQLKFRYKFFGDKKLRLKNRDNIYIYEFAESSLDN